MHDRSIIIVNEEMDEWMDHQYSICGKNRGVSAMYLGVFLTKPVDGQWKLGGVERHQREGLNPDK